MTQEPSFIENVFYLLTVTIVIAIVVTVFLFAIYSWKKDDEYTKWKNDKNK